MGHPFSLIQALDLPSMSVALTAFGVSIRFSSPECHKKADVSSLANYGECVCTNLDHENIKHNFARE